MGGTLLTSKGVTGFSQYGRNVSFKLIPFERLVVPGTPIEIPTSEPATANVTMEVLATDIPSCEPAGYYVNASGDSTYSGMYSTMYQAFFANSTAANITLYCKYVTNPATPSWSAQQSGAIYPSSTPRYPVIWCNGMGPYHAVGALQQFKFWASAAGLTCIGYGKTVVHYAPTTLGEQSVADLQIKLGNDTNGGLGRTASTGQQITFRASYPTGGASVTEYSCTLNSSFATTPLKLPHYTPNASLGFGVPYIVSYQTFNNTTDLALARLVPNEISYRVLR